MKIEIPPLLLSIPSQHICGQKWFKYSHIKHPVAICYSLYGSGRMDLSEALQEISMPLLEYVSDEHLLKEVEFLLAKAKKKKDDAEKTFNRNVIDHLARCSNPPDF